MSSAWLAIRVVSGSVGPLSALSAIGLSVGEATGQVDVGGGTWCVPLAFWALAVAHELGHVLAVDRLGAQLHETRSSRSRVTVVFGSIGPAHDAACVMAGPAAAFVVSVPVAVLLVGAGAATAAAGCLAIGVAHLVTLGLPWGDGAVLRTLLRERSAG